MLRQHHQKKKHWWQALGPGFITGASDDDPSGIGTYSQTGAQFGYQHLWLAWWSWPFMTIVQEMCGRIGLVTGRGLAAVIRQRYNRWVLYTLITVLGLANIINIGADLGAMAQTMQLLFGWPLLFWLILLAIITIALEVFVSYRTYARYLKYLTVALLAYAVCALIVQQDWLAVAQSTLIPQWHWTDDSIVNIIAVLGTTFSPYLFFWQASEEVEEEVLAHKLTDMNTIKPRITKADLRRMRWDTAVGMLLSNVIMFFIIVTSAVTLGQNGITHITTAADAATALQPLDGNLTYWLFAFGIIGTGLLAVPVLAASLSYAVSELLNWHEGLYRRWRQAPGFYGVIVLATVLGIVINILGIPPFVLLYYTAVLNGICAAPLLVMILLVANNRKIMGQHVNPWWANLAGGFIAVVLTGISFWLAGSFIL